MATELVKTEVFVKFEGTITVMVPKHLSKDDRITLAEKVAMSRILATDENVDAPDEEAFDEYESECSPEAKKTVEADFDACKTEGVGGKWEIGNPHFSTSTRKHQ